MRVRWAAAVLAQVVTFALGAASADAEAWPQEEGSGLIALGAFPSFATDGGAGYRPTLYLEYGVSRGRVVTLDLFGGDRDGPVRGNAMLRFPLSTGNAQTHLAMSGGIGLRDGGTVVTGGLSWGRDLAEGWMAVDALAALAPDGRFREGKLDATLGHHLSDRWAVTLKLQTYAARGDEPVLRIGPSTSWTLPGGLTLELGALKALGGEAGVGLTFGGWRSF